MLSPASPWLAACRWSRRRWAGLAESISKQALSYLARPFLRRLKGVRAFGGNYVLNIILPQGRYLVARHVKGDDPVSANEIGGFQHRRIPGQHHQVIGQSGGNSAGAK